MTRPVHGAPKHVRVSIIQTFLAGDASPTLKAEVGSLLNALEPFPTLDEVVLEEQQPALLARINLLPAPKLDLFRAFRGEKPQRGTHSRKNVAASLRYTRTKHGRPPLASDYPAGHIVPMLAQVYYGSMAAWGAGAPDREQRPKRFWRQRVNQLAALRQLASDHPGEAITHPFLSRSKLGSLASAVTAAELADLTEELGLDRNLKQLPAGHWTAEKAINDYVILCRERGVTLSSHALASIGGHAFFLRTLAARFFPSFRAFQLAAVERHPELRPAHRPTTMDGQLMDSWGEAVVYNALRRALPGVEIATHVLLPIGRGRRSCDLVVDGYVHVEVLGAAEADMPAARTSRQRKYARQWAVKRDYYRQHGVALVLFEPADVDDLARLELGVAKIAAHLAIEHIPLRPSTRGTVRANGTWTFEFLSQAVGEVAKRAGGFPTHVQLAAAGYSHAIAMLKQPGMSQRVSAAIGHQLRNRKGLWSREKVEVAMLAWVAEHAGYPTDPELRAAGQGGLADAKHRLFPGEQESLRVRIEQRCGRVLARQQAARGSYRTQEQLAAVLRPICDQLGHFPTGAEMASAGLPGTIFPLVSGRYGVANMAAFMGVSYAGPRTLTRAEALAELRSIPRKPDLLSPAGAPAPLTTTAIRAKLGSRGIYLMQEHFSNIAGLRAALAENGTSTRGSPESDVSDGSGAEKHGTEEGR